MLVLLHAVQVVTNMFSGVGDGEQGDLCPPLFEHGGRAPHFRASLTSHALNTLINTSKEAMYLHVPVVQ